MALAEGQRTDSLPSLRLLQLVKNNWPTKERCPQAHLALTNLCLCLGQEKRHRRRHLSGQEHLLLLTCLDPRETSRVSLPKGLFCTSRTNWASCECVPLLRKAMSTQVNCQGEKGRLKLSEWRSHIPHPSHSPCQLDSQISQSCQPPKPYRVLP